MATLTDKDILTFSDAVRAIDGKGPSKSGWYNGICPVPEHNDSRPSLGIKEYPDGGFAINCQTGCKRKQVIEALEAKTGKKYPSKKKAKDKRREPVERGLTLDQYAEMKRLPRKYLAYFGTLDYPYQGKSAVMHSYFDGEGKLAGLKLRLSADSHDTLWENHTKSVPYGLGHWDFCIQKQGFKAEWVVICEGESDTQTLFHSGIPALGISGKNGWDPDFANLPQLTDVKDVFIVQEPGAEDFVKAVAASFPSQRVHVLPFEEPAKDPSALWLTCKTQEEFLTAWDKIEAKATLINDGFEKSDTGNAERLVARHGENFRWIWDDEKFAVWDGKVWQRNESGDMLLPATKEVVRAIPNSKWRLASEGAGKRTAMIRMAKGETSVLADGSLFDKHPMLLNVQNGTLDLQTGELREFRREDYLTKTAAVEYDALADCPKFDAFMDFIFAGDKDTIHFVNKALGYTLTGSTAESCFFICYGLGANGKSTLIETLMQILGVDFARPAKFDTFVSSRMQSPKYEIATFKGARLITAVEPKKAGHLDEEVLKQITGGDKIMARDIYEKNVVFYPEFKLWLAMNNKPRIIGTDDGIWRRVRLVPFAVRVPDRMKVKEFHKVLFAEEGPGILNRLLYGLKDLMAEGLQMSGAVAKATEEFRDSQNILQGFFAAHTVQGNGMHARAGDIYTRYKQWAEELGEYVMRQNEFYEELERKKFKRQTVRGGAVEWYGIGLKDEENTPMLT